MNLLLISMPDIHPFFRTWKMMTPSLALASIAGNIDPRHSVGIADLILKRKDVKGAVLDALKRTDPEVVGLTAMSFQFDTAMRVARLIKETNPRIKIAIGGYHATLMYESIANSGDARYLDFIMRGEGDLSFNELMDGIENRRPLQTIDGLSYKTGGAFVHNGPRALEDLTKIKFPNRDARIWKGYHAFGVSYDTIESSRGCVLGCSFCSIRQMYGQSFRKYEIARVIEDIGRAKAAGARSLFFTDDNITLDVKRFEGLLDSIIENGHNDVSYIIQASSAGISSSAELARKMAKAQFRFVFLGVESFSEDNLSLLKKGNIANKSFEAIKLLKENDIHVVGGMIIGNPGDTFESIETNYKMARSLGVGSIYDQILTPYLKTEIREELLGHGLVTNKENYKHYNGHFANVKTRHLSADDLNRIKYKMVQRYSPCFLENVVSWRKIVLKHYSWFVLKLLPFGIKDYIFAKIKKLFLNDEDFFQRDYKRCIGENVFNVP